MERRSTLKRESFVQNSFKMLFPAGPVNHVPHQELVVLHHSPDGLVGDGGPAVPEPPPPLLPEHVPQPPGLHLLGTPPVEVLPGDAVQDLQVLGLQTNLIMLPRDHILLVPKVNRKKTVP